jgi:Glycosyl hydrolases family 2, sugar binding domain/Glycosyl hydrolases family 2/Glycosyl hydrolases family 2, TIM barrel domain
MNRNDQSRLAMSKATALFKVIHGTMSMLLGCHLLLTRNDLDAADWSFGNARLFTPWAKNVSPTNVWPEYPRPQLVRSDWLNLNGLWEYAFTEGATNSPAHFSGYILVPFPVESGLSGVAQPLKDNGKLWYHRQIAIPEAWRGRRVRLHFGAVDWHCQVWVNQKLVGEHQGGYDAFSFNISSALNWTGDEDILISVTDPTEGDQPRGKQSIKPEGVFYTSTSGIWQTVWLEPVPETCIERLKMTPDLDAQGLHLQVVGHAVGMPNAPVLLPVSSARLWSPEDPFLYDLEVKLKREGHEVDRVKSYFGMRSVGLQKDERGRMRVALNSKPIFQVGVLDQGFWPDGIYTAPTDEALRFDLEFLKRSGFNLVRKHVKVEPERWYYWCDKLGLLVWQDMPSANNSTPEARIDFEIELRRMIEGRFNHPSIAQWVLFNEGWGQYDTERLVKEIRKIDQSRLVDNAAGWTDMRTGDVIDTHSYPEPGGIEPNAQRATVLGEFGGIGFGVEGHTWSSESWGYQGAGNIEGVTAWYLRLMRAVWRLRSKAGLSACVFTQIADVETECNGLMTYDRTVLKIDPEILRRANRETPTSASGTVLLPNALNGSPPVWKYTFDAPGTNWINAAFDDSMWTNGGAGFGTPGTLGAFPQTLWNSDNIWLRRTFVLGEGDFSEAKFELHHDDECEVYLNGVLAAKLDAYLFDYLTVDILPSALRVLRPGTNFVTAHCHQTAGGQYFDLGIFVPDSTHTSELHNTP